MDVFFYISKTLGFLSTPTNGLLVLLLVGVVTLRWRFGRQLAGLAAIVLVICGLSPAANLLMAPLEQRFPHWDASKGTPDGIVVLGGALDGAVFGTRGELALNEAAERMTEAVALARTYPNARILFSGGEGNLVKHGHTEAEAARAFFERMGLPPGRIEVEDRSRNTTENAVFSKELAAPKPGERWLLVTSAWHMPRSIGCFRAAGFPVEAYPVDFRVPAGEGMLLPFFSASDGLRRFDLASREWIGLAAYYATGRSSALFPAP